jgi:hypothetical protein
MWEGVARVDATADKPIGYAAGALKRICDLQKETTSCSIKTG